MRPFVLILFLFVDAIMGSFLNHTDKTATTIVKSAHPERISVWNTGNGSTTVISDGIVNVNNLGNGELKVYVHGGGNVTFYNFNSGSVAVTIIGKGSVYGFSDAPTNISLLALTVIGNGAMYVNNSNLATSSISQLGTGAVYAVIQGVNNSAFTNTRNVSFYTIIRNGVIYERLVDKNTFNASFSLTHHPFVSSIAANGSVPTIDIVPEQSVFSPLLFVVIIISIAFPILCCMVYCWFYLVKRTSNAIQDAGIHKELHISEATSIYTPDDVELSVENANRFVPHPPASIE